MSSTRSASNRGRRAGLYVTAGLGLPALIGVGALSWFGLGGAGSSVLDPGLTYRVREEPMTVSVTESGTIEARDRVVVKSQVEGQNTILHLIEEGRRVEKGDLLVELDASSLKDTLTEEEIELQNAEAELTSARENLAVVKNQAQADIDQARLDHRFAEQDLEKYTADRGEAAMKRRELESTITLAEQEWEQARQTASGSQQLYDKKYISERELQSDELAAERARLDFELAEQELALWEQYTYDRKLAELKSQVQQTEMALERVKRKAKANIAEAEARLNARQGEVHRKRSSVKDLKRQIEHCEIEAPTAGTVVYAPQGNRWDDEVLEEGTSVRERQELIYLPTANKMSATISVHESVLRKVSEGQRARVTVDALPNTSFSGAVTDIAVMPEDGGWRNPDLKQYKTRIALTGATPSLRSGMSCRAEILVARYESALTVPLQAVLRVGGRPTVFVVGAQGRPTARAIELGMDNNRKVRVLGGLEAGESVMLDPPLAEAEREAFGIDDEAEVTGASSGAETRPAHDGNGGSDGSAGAAELDERTRRTLRMLRGLRKRDALDRLELGDAARDEVDAALDALEQGETPQLSDELRATIRSKMRQMMEKFRERRGGREGEGANGGRS